MILDDGWVPKGKVQLNYLAREQARVWEELDSSQRPDPEDRGDLQDGAGRFDWHPQDAWKRQTEEHGQLKTKIQTHESQAPALLLRNTVNSTYIHLGTGEWRGVFPELTHPPPASRHTAEMTVVST